jgi:hypothetical protein
MPKLKLAILAPNHVTLQVTLLSWDFKISLGWNIKQEEVFIYISWS